MSDNTGATNAVGLTFLFLYEDDTIEALAARIIPGTAEDAGARKAGVAAYIDRALSGPYFRWHGVHREGVRTINGYTIQRYGKMFFELSETDQDAVVGALEKGETLVSAIPKAGSFRRTMAITPQIPSRR